MADRVRAACEACFPAHKDDCSAFARAVAGTFGIVLEPPADRIVDTLRGGAGGWTQLADGPAAAKQAAAGMLVLGGLKGGEQANPSPHGHVVVVVDGPLARDKYPSAYWGSLSGHPGENQTTNFAWLPEDRDRVTYAAVPIEAVATTATERLAVTADTDALGFLPAAIAAAAPHADAALWARVMAPHLVASGLTTPRRVAAFLGQVAVEAGPALAELAENTLYTRPERLCAVFPSRFPTLSLAQQYAGDPERIACRAYAGKLGNGDEASGDGWRFRGSGLMQVTGRDAHTAFATLLDAPIDLVVQWMRVPQGAVASACWYWRSHHLNSLADAWDLAGITVAVNGAAMLDHAQRVAASEAALRASGGA